MAELLTSSFVPLFNVGHYSALFFAADCPSMPTLQDMENQPSPICLDGEIL